MRELRVEGEFDMAQLHERLQAAYPDWIGEQQLRMEGSEELMDPEPVARYIVRRPPGELVIFFPEDSEARDKQVLALIESCRL